MIEYVTPSPAVEFATPVHQEQIAAPPPAVFYPSFSQQLPPADINGAVAVEASAPQDVGLLLASNGHVVDIPVPRGVEEIEDVVEDQIFDALVPQTVEEHFVAVTPTLATTDATFPHEKFDEACKILALKQAHLRQAKLVLQRLELYAAVSGQACDANLVSEARQAYESNKVIIGSNLREIDALQALRPRAAAERLNEERLLHLRQSSEEQRRAGTNNELWTVYEWR